MAQQGWMKHYNQVVQERVRTYQEWRREAMQSGQFPIAASSDGEIVVKGTVGKTRIVKKVRETRKHP